MQLDDAFAVGAHIPQAETFPPHWAAEAQAFRTNLGSRAELGVSYGPSLRQAFDVFHCKGEAQGTLIFVHGGYWLRFDRSSWSHFAHGALSAGWNVALIEYDLCPTVSIAQITVQVAKAVTMIAARNGLPISLTGHSAGGHLVSRMLAPDVLPPEVLARVSGAAPISPVADLRPLLQTSMNEEFKMNLQAAEAESPVLQPAPDVPVRIWVGADERPVFLQQAEALARAWDVTCDVVPDRHHFDVIDALIDPQSDMVRYLTSQ